jgi:hypothetical protein
MVFPLVIQDDMNLLGTVSTDVRSKHNAERRKKGKNPDRHFIRPKNINSTLISSRKQVQC